MKMNKMTFDLKLYLTDMQTVINETLTRIIDQFDQQRELICAMSHSLMAGGKRLRPILSMAAATVCGKPSAIALPAGCAIEMIHTYSLIHDDLPAMDDDDLRRGMPTCHKQFSEATAILAGDALLTHAFHLLSRPHLYFDQYPGPETTVELIAAISDAAGTNGMVEGQMLDMQAFDSDNESTLEHLKLIHGLKTGRMICASVETGAISAQAAPDVTADLVVYARKIGMAFQVVDDILNVEGDPRIMGKAAGSDALNDKMTFPGQIGLDESKKYAKALIDDAQDALSGFDTKKSAPLRAIAQYIINRDH